MGQNLRSPTQATMAKRILIIGNSDGIGAAVTTTLVARISRVWCS